jgi:VanZ family protein
MVAPSRIGGTPASVVLAIAVLLVIAAVTLTPSTSYSELPFGCVICGSLGGLDFALNVVLFLPLGMTLYLAWRRPGPVIMATVIVTLSIELAQWRLLPGRDASLGDLVANTLGGALGLLLGRYAPAGFSLSGRKGQLMSGAVACLVAGVIWLGSWLIVPIPARWVFYVQWALPQPHLDPFPGVVLSTSVNGKLLSATERVHPVDEYVDSTGRIDVDVTILHTGSATQRRAMILAMANPIEERVFLGQWRHAAVVRVHTNASRWRLRSPMARSDWILAPDRSTDSAGPGLVRITASISAEGTSLARHSGGARSGTWTPRTAGLGWIVLWPREISVGSGLPLLKRLLLGGRGRVCG